MSVFQRPAIFGMPESASVMDSIGARSRTTVARWLPALSMMLVSLISYIDRNTLALLAPTILRELGLTTEQYGFIVSAFSIAYMLSNPLWGYWLDRFGLRHGMIAAVLTWTLASVSHAFTQGFAGLAAARAALGFGEGATFPGGLRTVMQTLPIEQRSRGVALAYSGGSLGAVVTPIVITPIVVWWGWRAAFWFTGLIGSLWISHWWFVSRRPDLGDPSAGPRSAEGAPLPPRLVARETGSTASLHFADRRLWSFMCAYALGAMPLGFILYISAIYLSQALGKSQLQIGKVLWIPPLGWEVGYFFWGYMTDRGLRLGRLSLALHRRLMSLALVFSLPLALTTRLASYPLVMGELFLAMFVAAGFVILAISYATSIYSTRHAGLISGLGAGSWSAIIAIVMPYFGRLFDQQRYDTAFVLATCFPVVGFAAWWALSREPRKSG